MHSYYSLPIPFSSSYLCVCPLPLFTNLFPTNPCPRFVSLGLLCEPSSLAKTICVD